jgi:hypothetical protein
MDREVTLENDGKEINRSVRLDIIKVATAGVVLCKLCQKTVVYGKRGFVAISDHIKTQKHRLRVSETLKNQSIKCFVNQVIGLENY